MNETTFAMMASIINKTYPKDNILGDNEAVTIWYEFLKDIPDEIGLAAVRDWVSRNIWPPHISDIREYAARQALGEVSDWGTAWGQVMKAVSGYGTYQEAEALATLDELTRECVKNLGFQSICKAEFKELDFMKSQFKDLYNRKVEKRLRDVQSPSYLTIGTEGQQLIGG